MRGGEERTEGRKGRKVEGEEREEGRRADVGDALALVHPLLDAAEEGII